MSANAEMFSRRKRKRAWLLEALKPKTKFWRWSLMFSSVYGTRVL